ncbi:MAG: hypothetical protein AAGA77_15350 [Bacteroidota bacterium]
MDYYDRIEEYLKNTLSEAEKFAFEKVMEQDADLKSAVENHEAAMDVVGSILEGEIRNVIENEQLVIDNEGSGIENGKLKIENGAAIGKVENEGKEAKIKRLTWMRRAGVAILLLMLGWWGMFLFGTTDTKLAKTIYADNFEPAPVDISKKGIKMEKKLDEINSNYNSANYLLVVDALNKLNIDSIGDNSLILMLGSSLIINGNFEESRVAMQPLQFSLQFQNEYYWYSAMSFLAEGELINARRLLSKISEDSYYSDKAKAILNQTR